LIIFENVKDENSFVDMYEIFYDDHIYEEDSCNGNVLVSFFI